jgi:hypothetical protein
MPGAGRMRRRVVHADRAPDSHHPCHAARDHVVGCRTSDRHGDGSVDRRRAGRAHIRSCRGSTGSDGSFVLTATATPPTNPYRVALFADGLVTHDVWLNWERGARTGIAVGCDRNAAPFSMVFYRQFVRGTYDTPGVPYVVLRWMDAPRF